MIRQWYEKISTKFYLDWMKFKNRPFSAIFSKSYLASDRKHGQMNLHKKFQLDISKNGRDTLRFLLHSGVHQLQSTIQCEHFIYRLTKWRHYTTSLITVGTETNKFKNKQTFAVWHFLEAAAPRALHLTSPPLSSQSTNVRSRLLSRVLSRSIRRERTYHWLGSG